MSMSVDAVDGDSKSDDGLRTEFATKRKISSVWKQFVTLKVGKLNKAVCKHCINKQEFVVSSEQLCQFIL